MKEETDIVELLSYLNLPFIREKHKDVARTAAERQWSHIEYLAELVRGEADMRKDRAVKRRIGTARFPVIKTLEQFDWLWPKKNQQAADSKSVPSQFRARKGECRLHRRRRARQDPSGGGPGLPCLSKRAFRSFHVRRRRRQRPVSGPADGPIEAKIEKIPETFGPDTGRTRLSADRQNGRRSAFPDNQPALRKRNGSHNHEPGLQGVAENLQQRQHFDLGASGQIAAPYGNSRNRGKSLSNEGRSQIDFSKIRRKKGVVFRRISFFFNAFSNRR